MFSLSLKKNPGGINGFSASVALAIISGVTLFNNSFSSYSDLYLEICDLSLILNLLNELPLAALRDGFSFDNNPKNYPLNISFTFNSVSTTMINYSNNIFISNSNLTHPKTDITLFNFLTIFLYCCLIANH